MNDVRADCSTPPQNLNVVLDTGSADFWSAGDSCVGQYCPKQQQFAKSTSSTWNGTGEEFRLKYGIGDVSGEAGTDTVSLAGITVEAQGTGVVDTVQVQAVSDPMSGILGLAFESIASLGKPWWQAAFEQDAVSQKVFGFWLGRNADDPNAPTAEANGGEFTMGGIDSSRFSGEVNYIPLSGEDYWRIPVDRVAINGAAVSGMEGKQCAIDTGTSFIATTSELAKQFYAQVPGAQPHSEPELRDRGYWEYDCSTDFSVSFTFGGIAYDINAADFNLKGFTSSTTSCVGAIFELSLDTSAPVDFIVGDSFLKNVYSVYDYERKAVGFGIAKH